MVLLFTNIILNVDNYLVQATSPCQVTATGKIQVYTYLVGGSTYYLAEVESQPGDLECGSGEWVCIYTPLHGSNATSPATFPSIEAFLKFAAQRRETEALNVERVATK